MASRETSVPTRGLQPKQDFCHRLPENQKTGSNPLKTMVPVSCTTGTIPYRLQRPSNAGPAFCVTIGPFSSVRRPSDLRPRRVTHRSTGPPERYGSAGRLCCLSYHCDPQYYLQHHGIYFVISPVPALSSATDGSPSNFAGVS